MSSLASGEFNPHQIHMLYKVNAAVVNVSGRQRMLSQRTAMLSLRLVSSKSSQERDQLRQLLQNAIDLMERSHHGLIYGDSSMNLPGQPSPAVQAMYFEAPLYLDQQVRRYITEVSALLQLPEAALTAHNPTLQFILQAASTQLLESLDAVVSQYQKEGDAEQDEMLAHQAELYRRNCRATETATAQAQQLEQALAELRQAQAQLVQSEKMSSLGQLVAGIAHEINNPVNFIFGNIKHAIEYTENVLDLVRLYQQYYPNPAPEIQSTIDEIDLDFLISDFPKLMSSVTVGVERIKAIVASLRTFSRMDEAQCKAVNIHDGIESTLMILQHRLKANTRCLADVEKTRPAIQIVTEYGDLPLIECYAGQLNQVFMNILSNAIDAIDEQFESGNSCEFQPQIKIRTEVTSTDVIICIADNGNGIPPDVQQRLFDPFFTTKPVGKGTGMGLSISYQIITERHGGTLRCVSALGKGAEFIIAIPLQQPQ